MDEAKTGLRRRFRLERSAIPAAERVRVDAAIARHLVDLPAYCEADLILAYLSFAAEVETRGIIRRAWDDGKVVAIPRCAAGTRLMGWHRIDTFGGLVRSPLGVDEPADDPSTLVDPASASSVLALVPGLAFDARGYRLGYGGGFYDVFLAGFAGTSVGLCREAQRVDDLRALGAVNAYDEPVDVVMDERGTTIHA